MTTEQNLGPERLSLLACSPVPGAGTSLGGERRAREISDRNEETVKTESSQQHGELVPVGKDDEVIVVVASENKTRITPREKRIKVQLSECSAVTDLFGRKDACIKATGES